MCELHAYGSLSALCINGGQPGSREPPQTLNGLSSAVEFRETFPVLASWEILNEGLYLADF